MDKYYVVIQIITGVNFVFILSNFLQRTIKELYDIQAHLDANNNRYANKWLLDAETANTLTFQNGEGKNNSEVIKKLSMDYQNIAGIWTEWCNWLKCFNDKVSSRMGFQTLFLLGSMYCVGDLFLMAYYYGHSEESVFTYYMMSLNVLFLIVMLIVSIRILVGCVKKEKEENLQFSFWFVLVYVIALIIISFLPQNIQDLFPSSSTVAEINRKVAIALPFLPCLLGVLYIFIVELVNKIVYRVLYWCCSARAIGPNIQKKKLEDIRKTFNAGEYRYS